MASFLENTKGVLSKRGTPTWGGGGLGLAWYWFAIGPVDWLSISSYWLVFCWTQPPLGTFWKQERFLLNLLKGDRPFAKGLGASQLYLFL